MGLLSSEQQIPMTENELLNNIYSQPRDPSLPNDSAEDTMMINSHTKLMWEVEQTIRELEYTWRGYVKVLDKKGNLTWNIPDGVEQKDVCLMNEIGIRDLIGCVRTKLGKHIFLSNFAADDVRRMAQETRAAVRRMLELGFLTYSLKRRHLDHILTSIDQINYASIRRAYMNGERQVIRHTNRENNTLSNETSNKGFFNKFLKV